MVTYVDFQGSATDVFVFLARLHQSRNVKDTLARELSHIVNDLGPWSKDLSKGDERNKIKRFTRYRYSLAMNHSLVSSTETRGLPFVSSPAYMHQSRHVSTKRNAVRLKPRQRRSSLQTYDDPSLAPLIRPRTILRKSEQIFAVRSRSYRGGLPISSFEDRRRMQIRV